MINAKVKRKHRNSYKLIYTALFICTLLAYLLTNDLFYSYVCYWNDRFYANPQWNPVIQAVDSRQLMERRRFGKDTDHRRHGGKHT